MNKLIFLFFVHLGLSASAQTNSYTIGSSTSNTQATYMVPADKIWSIITVDDGCYISTDVYVVGYMGENSVIMVPLDEVSGTLLMTLPVILQPSQTYQFSCNKGAYIRIMEYNK